MESYEHSLLIAGTNAMPSFECPTCQKMFAVECNEDAPFRPFCCERCKMVDLGRWLDGTYRTSSTATPEELSESVRQNDDDSQLE